MDIKSKALKTGISVFLAVILSKFLKLKFPFFAALPSIMPMSNSAEETLKAGRNRIFGTLIGAVVGALFVLIYPGNALLSGIGMILIIYLCNFIRWGNAAAIAGLVYISIMVGIKRENPWIYSFHRLLATIIGVCVTVLVNNLIFRTNLLVLVNKDSIEIKEMIDRLIKEKICSSSSPIDMENLNLKIENIKDKLSICIEEYGSSKGKQERLSNLKDKVSSLISIQDHLKIVCIINRPVLINSENRGKLKNAYNCGLGEDFYEDTNDNIVFNYHLGEILDKLHHINKVFEKDKR